MARTIGGICDFVCLRVRGLKEKRLELPTPNLADMRCLAVAQYALIPRSKSRMLRSRGYDTRCQSGYADRYDCSSFCGYFVAGGRSLPVGTMPLDLPPSERVPGPVLHCVTFNYNGQLVLASAEMSLLVWSADTAHLVRPPNTKFLYGIRNR